MPIADPSATQHARMSLNVIRPCQGFTQQLGLLTVPTARTHVHRGDNTNSKYSRNIIISIYIFSDAGWLAAS
jgi:hypothetical protein